MRRAKAQASSPGPLGPEALAVRPVRTAEWSERDDRVVVERPLPPISGLRGWLARVSALTGVRRVRLDETGSFAWRRFDGATSVGEVAKALREEREEPAEDVGERLVWFVRTLRREGLVGLPGRDDEAIDRWRARPPTGAPAEGSAGNPAP